VLFRLPVLLLQDVKAPFDFTATLKFEASRPARVIPKASKDEPAPLSPTLLAAITDRISFAGVATTISKHESNNAKALGAAQLSATTAAINVNAAAHETFLQDMSKAQRIAYFNSSVCATAEEVAAGAVEDVDFDLAFEMAMADLAAERQDFRDTSQEKAKPTVSIRTPMRLSEDLHKEDQMMSIACVPAAAR
jgi:hypothetical protein